MKHSKIIEFSEQHHLKRRHVSKDEFVRAIQEAEGNQRCFNSYRSEKCGEHSCLWREECV